MTIQRLAAEDFTPLQNPGVTSHQLVWPRNAPDAQVTITRVFMQPGAVQRRHAHAASEQIWLIESGEATLLSEGGDSPMRAGDIVRTPAGDIHGIENTGAEPFVYLSVTSPPQDFAYAYGRKR